MIKKTVALTQINLVAITVNRLFHIQQAVEYKHLIRTERRYRPASRARNKGGAVTSTR